MWHFVFLHKWEKATAESFHSTSSAYWWQWCECIGKHCLKWNVPCVKLLFWWTLFSLFMLQLQNCFAGSAVLLGKKDTTRPGLGQVEGWQFMCLLPIFEWMKGDNLIGWFVRKTGDECFCIWLFVIVEDSFTWHLWNGSTAEMELKNSDMLST